MSKIDLNIIKLLGTGINALKILLKKYNIRHLKRQVNL